MASIVRHRPHGRLSRYDDRYPLLDNVLGGLYYDPPLEEEEDYYPPLDIYHNDEVYTLRFELPGVGQDSIRIRCEGDLFIIEGEKRHEGSMSYHRVESRCGSFHRSVNLPDTLDKEKIDARFSGGVLTVSFPILEKVKPKEIPLHVE